MAFVASIVHSVAWPAGVVVATVIFRKPIGTAINRRMRRLKAGPFEAEFDPVTAEVREELAKSPELADVEVPAVTGGLQYDLAPLIVTSPRAAVLEAFARIELRLRELVAGAGAAPVERGWPTVRGLAMQARKLGLISEETLAAIDGLATLRNLAAHSFGGEISPDRASQFLVLADAVMFALRPKPLSGGE
jgi:hypothetical protein